MKIPPRDGLMIQEIPVRNILDYLHRARYHFQRKLWLIGLFVLVGSLVAIGYALFMKPFYNATCTFVLDEESKQSGLFNQYAGLASLAGVNVNNVNGLFQGDNILELYKSRTMIEKTLLAPSDYDGKQELLIDKYIRFNKLGEKWAARNGSGAIRFGGDPSKFNRLQDSVISNIIELFNKNQLNVFKPDKKLSIIEVDFSSKDEAFSKEFTNQLVQTVNEFYVKTITQKAAKNVALLQRQADSVKASLNKSIGSVAADRESAPNANSQLFSLLVPSQRKQVDVQAATSIYSVIVQNLELAKISLRQATPLIQLIDSPVVPLKNNRPGLVKSAIVGGMAGFFLAIVYLYLRLFYLKLQTDKIEE